MDESPSRPLVLLQVNDDPTDSIASAFEEQTVGVTVDTATSAADGLAALDSERFDCVVSGYELPERDGIDFLEAVRAEYPRLPFILYTDDGSEEVASEAISAGVTDYVQKSSGSDQPTVLANRITNAVESYRSQRALAERKQVLERYERMVNAMHEAACIYDADGRFEVVNEYLADWYGTTREDLEGDSSGLVPHVRAEGDGDPFRELFEGEREEVSGTVSAEFPHHGEAVLEYQLTPLRVDGAIEGVVGVARDVTERIEYKRELEQTNALLSSLFDTLPQGVLVEDGSRNVLTVNQRLFDLFGLPGTQEDVVGADCEELARSVDGMFDDNEDFLDRVDDIIAARAPVDAEELSLADGRTFERTYRSVELPDDDGHLWVYEDVTERVEHERRLEALSQATRDLLSADSREDVAELGVEVARAVLGLDASAIYLYDEDQDALLPAATTSAVIDLVGDPPTFARGEGIAWRTYERGEVVAIDDISDDPDRYNPETPIDSELFAPIAEDGLLIAGSPEPAAFDDGDVLLGDILAGNIATALEQVERTERLRTRETELTRQNERLEQFASIVSHDLRNPLNVAEMRLELLADDCNSDHIPPIERSHDRMATLIEDLLVLARHGESEADREPVSLPALVEQCWATVDTVDATIDIETERTVEADRSRLKQLFENLIRNSVEHGSTGSRPRADDSAEHAGDSVTVTVGDLADGFYVADDGPGIPPEDRERVFDLGHSTSDTGTGVGLHVVEQTVAAHGWHVRATESADGGARFEITGVPFVDGS